MSDSSNNTKNTEPVEDKFERNVTTSGEKYEVGSLIEPVVERNPDVAEAPPHKSTKPVLDGESHEGGGAEPEGDSVQEIPGMITTKATSLKKAE